MSKDIQTLKGFTPPDIPLEDIVPSDRVNGLNFIVQKYGSLSYTDLANILFHEWEKLNRNRSDGNLYTLSHWDPYYKKNITWRSEIKKDPKQAVNILLKHISAKKVYHKKIDPQELFARAIYNDNQLKAVLAKTRKHKLISTLLYYLNKKGYHLTRDMLRGMIDKLKELIYNVCYIACSAGDQYSMIDSGLSYLTPRKYVFRKKEKKYNADPYRFCPPLKRYRGDEWNDHWKNYQSVSKMRMPRNERKIIQDVVTYFSVIDKKISFNERLAMAKEFVYEQ